MATTTTENEDENDPIAGPPGAVTGAAPLLPPIPAAKPARPLYLSWRLWFLISLVLLLASVVTFLIVGPNAINAIITALGAWVTGSGLWGLIVKFIWPPLWEEIKKNNERTKTNTEDITFLRTSYESLGKQYYQINHMYERVNNDLQQERTESKLVAAENKAEIAALTKQNHRQQAEIDRIRETHKQEIANLNEQIRLLGLEKSSDKEEIIKLKGQVKQLTDRVAELEDREAKLADEKAKVEEKLKQYEHGQRRRSTDQLTGLSPDAETRLAHLETEKERER